MQGSEILETIKAGTMANSNRMAFPPWCLRISLLPRMTLEALGSAR